MPRYYKKRYYRGSKKKYSVEHKQSRIDIPAAPSQSYLEIVPQTGVEGMRKVKHITITGAANVTSGIGALYWALVYVPEGYNVNQLNLTGGASLYEPNQNVMSCGVFDFEGGPLRIHCPLARNLNSGDHIFLVVANTSTSTFTLYSTIQYSITLH